MSSHELLELLTSGAAFKRKASKSKAKTSTEDRLATITPPSSARFFAPATSEGKRERQQPGKDDPERDESPSRAQQRSTQGEGRNAGGMSLRRVSNRANGNQSRVSMFGKTTDTTSHTAAANVTTSDSDLGSTHREGIACFRRQMGIRIRGEEVTDPMESFLEMPTASEGDYAKLTRRALLRNIEESAWKEPTPVQMQAVPILVSGRDLLAAAPTGSGKTAAFVIPIILRLGACRTDASRSEEGTRAVVLAPTRELAAQIHRDVVRLSHGRKLRTCLLTKAGAAKAAAATSADGAKALSCYDILVSTPMRLVALLREGAINLASVQMLVMDEADKLFDAGRGNDGSDKAFVGQIDEILGACSHVEVQRALFSATIGQKVKELAESVLRDPVFLSVGTENAGAKNIEQRLVYVGKEEGKLLAIRQLVQDGLQTPVLIFLQSKDRAKDLFHELVYDGINTDVMHASRTQDQRDRIIQRFRTGEIWVLICTDLMARGIDFKGVNMVINYDFPQSAVSYIHRIGRTGRAGRAGVAVTFFTEADMDSLRGIANVMRLSGCEVPDWMLSMKRARGSDRRERESHAPRRDGIATASKYDLRKKRRRQFMVNDSKKAAAFEVQRGREH